MRSIKKKKTFTVIFKQFFKNIHKWLSLIKFFYLLTWIEIGLVWFLLFNRIATFLGLFNAKVILLLNSSGTI